MTCGAPGMRIPDALCFLCWLTLSFPVHADPCTPAGHGQQARVAHVTDGDTIVLDDGRRVRLIGVNAPELGRDGASDQPLAREARQLVEKMLAEAPLVLYVGDQRRDSHGRWLAHLAAGGDSVERELVARGLAYHVAIPPNLGLVECLRTAEFEARSARLGLWGMEGAGPVASDAVVTGGYQRVRGRVERLLFGDAWWIEFAGGFRAVIYPEHQRYWSRQALAGWRGQVIEVRGWVYRSRRGEWRMRLPTPDARLPDLP